MKSISIVIPSYNSEDCLGECYKQLQLALSDFKFEVIFVNDQSTDGTWKKIQELAQNNNVKGVNLRKNSGQDNAIMAGLRHVSNDFIIIMDDDLQHSPSDIPTLINQMEKENLDVCFAKFTKLKQAFWKNWGSWFNGKIAEIYLNKKPNIYISPFKCLRKDLVDEIIKYEGSFPYIDAIIFSLTSNYDQVEVEHHDRFSGVTTYNFSKSLKVFFKMFFSYSLIPLRLATWVGITSSIGAFLLGLYHTIVYFVSDINIVEGWTTTVVLITFFGGINLIFLGVIGEYLGRLYLKSNYFPQYTVKEVVSASHD